MGMFDSVAGGLFDFATSAWSQNEEQKYNTAEAQANRRFQEDMSNTQYQRMVTDLNKAGLSPMLAYSKGGSTVPSGATASSTSPVKSDMSGAVKRDVESGLLREQMEVAKSQQILNESSAVKMAAETRNIDQDTENKRLYPGMNQAQIQELISRSGQHGASAGQLTALMDEIRQKIAIDKPKERFATEEPEKAKWLNPLRDALQTIFQGIGTISSARGISRTTTTQGPKGTTVQTTKGNR